MNNYLFNDFDLPIMLLVNLVMTILLQPMLLVVMMLMESMKG